MLNAIAAISGLCLIFGLLLGYSARRFRVEGDPVADQIDALLPQTQCGQCNYPGCRPYAEAIASGEADINQCPPGGETVEDGVRRRLAGRLLAVGLHHGPARRGDPEQDAGLRALAEVEDRVGPVEEFWQGVRDTHT